MKTVLLSAILLFGLISRGVSASDKPWQPPATDPRVVSTERITVFVVTTVNTFQIVVVWKDHSGHLLLTARQPMTEHFQPGNMLGLEKAYLLYELTGKRDASFMLVPPAGYKWRIPIKSVEPYAMPSTPLPTPRPLSIVY
jgi:hypothetical protein